MRITKQFIFLLIIIISSAFCQSNINANGNEHVCDNILSLIKKNEHIKLMDYFSNEIVIEESGLFFEKVSRNNNYNGFKSRKGNLYSILFEITKSTGNFKKIVNNSYTSIKNVLLKSKESGCFLDDDLPQLGLFFNERNYNIFFKKTSNHKYKIIRIKLSHNDFTPF